MKLESVGILISMQPFGERDVIARFFTSDFGVLCGVLKGGQCAKKNKPLVGQLGAVSWNARLDSQLGVFHWEAEKNLIAVLMPFRKSLEYINSAFALISTLLPEREKNSFLYTGTIDLLAKLKSAGADAAYLQWEISLLKELGYALNLTACSGCGRNENLEYLSPRTGRAVCKECAKPYVDKLYKLPLDLNISYAFLEKACVEQGVKIPIARIRLS